MDLVLQAADEYFFDSFYNYILPSSLSPYFTHRSSSIRQITSIWLVEMASVLFFYFGGSSFAYFLLFDKNLKKNPKYLKNQISKEIWLSTTSFPITAVATLPWIYFEVNGYSKLYSNVDEYGWGYLIFSILWFLAFTDFGVYWIHRFEHHPSLYSWLHKPHHTWKITTPFASFAFHPLDGYFQSLPIHIFVYLFPMHIVAYLSAFVFIQFWTISIHDGVYLVSNEYINGAAHHNVHHLEFNYNYGQYFTLWDRIGKTWRKPEKEFKHEMFMDKLRMNKADSKIHLD